MVITRFVSRVVELSQGVGAGVVRRLDESDRPTEVSPDRVERRWSSDPALDIPTWMRSGLVMRSRFAHSVSYFLTWAASLRNSWYRLVKLAPSEFT